MADLYVIRDWDKHFEHPDHRRKAVKRMHWVKVPNKLHGDGYAWLVDHKEGPAHFGVWVALLEVASLCKPRGELWQDFKVPHDPFSLSRKMRMPQLLIEQALERLSSIRWVEIQQRACTVLEKVPPTGQDRRGQNKTGQKKDPSDLFVQGHPAFDVAVNLIEAIKSHSPNAKPCQKPVVTAKRWAKDIDLAIRRDKRTPDELRAVIRFAHIDDPTGFWRSNLLSGTKLRAQFDAIHVRLNGQPAQADLYDPTEDAEWLAE